MARLQSRKSLQKCVAVFGESKNDADAVAHLVESLRSDLRAIPLSSPIVFIDRSARESPRVRGNVQRIVQAARALTVRFDVRAIVVHKDTDDFEPSHVRLARAIQDSFHSEPFCCVPSVAAWEIEAWWYLWPEAVAAVNRNWLPLKRQGTKVGLVRNVKEVLTRELRPRKRTLEYRESHAPLIAMQVKELGLVSGLAAQSDSFLTFRSGVLAI